MSSFQPSLQSPQTPARSAFRLFVMTLLLAVGLIACGGGDEPAADGKGRPQAGAESGGDGAKSGRPGAGERPGGGPPGSAWGAGAELPERGVPVEVETITRQDIAAYFQTQGTLEAENEVDLVARVAGPITELLTEEGRRVRRGDLLAKVDDRELAAQLEIARVRLDESRQGYERVRSLHDNQLVSQEALDQSLASFQAAQGEHDRLEIQLEYTRIRAPFSGLIVQRYIKLAQQVGVGTELFRLSDFDPLLCIIQVPERELRRLRPGQQAEVTVEAWGDRRFAAHVLRVAPVVDAGSGTVRVTLQMDEAVVDGEQVLDPGMFASVYLEMETRSGVVALPRSALALDTLVDSVFIAKDGVAQRRTVELGLRNDRFMEVVSGVATGEQVIVVGQDGLSDGTPVDVVGDAPAGSREAPEEMPDAARAAAPETPSGTADGAPSRTGRGAGAADGRPFADIDLDDPEQVKQMRQRMAQRGLSEAEIDERLESLRQRRGDGS